MECSTISIKVDGKFTRSILYAVQKLLRLPGLQLSWHRHSRRGQEARYRGRHSRGQYTVIIFSTDTMQMHLLMTDRHIWLNIYS